MDLTSFDEKQLKSILLDKLSGDFIFKSEVRGINLVEQRLIIIDFLAMAKPHIVASGFTSKWFGIEVKNIYEAGGNVPKGKKVNQVCWQSLTYAQSVFEGKRPPFVFMFLNDPYSTKGLIAFLQYGNVGRLKLTKVGYCFEFTMGYFGKSGNNIYKGKTNSGINRYVGNVIGNKQMRKKQGREYI